MQIPCFYYSIANLPPIRSIDVLLFVNDALSKPLVHGSILDAAELRYCRLDLETGDLAQSWVVDGDMLPFRRCLAHRARSSESGV